MSESNAPKMQEWIKRIETWQSSGKTIKAWCLENAISYATFYYWRKRLSLVIRKENTISPFIELPEGNPSLDFELEFKGATFRLTPSFDTTTFARCLQVLRDF